jgi:hypothetical protein
VSSEYPGASGGCGNGGGGGSNRENCAIPLSSQCGSGKAIGDPSFLMVVPSSQYREDYTISVPSTSITGQNVDDYLTFVLPENAVLNLNGENPEAPTSSLASEDVVVTALPNTQWRTVTLPVEAGTHVASANEAFGLIVYGYGCAFSYAYPGGLNLETQ